VISSNVGGGGGALEVPVAPLAELDEVPALFAPAPQPVIAAKIIIVAISTGNINRDCKPRCLDGLAARLAEFCSRPSRVCWEQGLR